MAAMETVEMVDVHFLLLMAEILHQLIGSFSHYLYGFIHPRWCKISAINSMYDLIIHNMLNHLSIWEIFSINSVTSMHLYNWKSSSKL